LLRGNGTRCWVGAEVDDVEMASRVAGCYARAVL
jgi:hypothetical protein